MYCTQLWCLVNNYADFQNSIKKMHSVDELTLFRLVISQTTMEKCECSEESDESEGEADVILIVDQSMPLDYAWQNGTGNHGCFPHI